MRNAMPKNQIYGSNIVCWTVLLLVSILSSHATLAEPPEGLDFIGGYYENGEYRCYSEPCFTIHKGTEAAAERIRPFNKREWIPKKKSCLKAYTQVLADSSLEEISYAKKGDCLFVVKGKWKDPYTSVEIEAIRNLAIDQRISYQEAHRYGAAIWNHKQRMELVNDPLNLVPVSISSKKKRQGKRASEWMPENKSYWCDYIVRRDMVIRKYKLFLPTVEREFHKKIKTLYCKF